MPSGTIRIAEGIEAGGGAPLLLVAGPCLVESEKHALFMAEALRKIAEDRKIPLVFKSSVDKANRTSVGSRRGDGVEAGLRILAKVKAETGLPVTSDFHTPEQARIFAETVDLLQVPAFLCRQTDMLKEAAWTGLPVNVKKGQFVAPRDAKNIVEKLREFDCDNIMLTERGATFGYNNLVVDFRSIPIMRDAASVPVCFDATHSVQLPGGRGGSSGGERQYVETLARAAVAVGVDALFFEVHDDPDNAPCDGPNMIRLDAFPALLDRVLAIDEAARR